MRIAEDLTGVIIGGDDPTFGIGNQYAVETLLGQ